METDSFWNTKTDWKRFGLALGKTDEPDFRREIGAVQLRCKVTICCNTVSKVYRLSEEKCQSDDGTNRRVIFSSCCFHVHTQP